MTRVPISTTEWLDRLARRERVMRMITDDNPSHRRWYYDADRCYDCGSQFIAHRCCMEERTTDG